MRWSLACWFGERRAAETEAAREKHAVCSRQFFYLARKAARRSSRIEKFVARLTTHHLYARWRREVKERLETILRKNARIFIAARCQRKTRNTFGKRKSQTRRWASLVENTLTLVPMLRVGTHRRDAPRPRSSVNAKPCRTSCQRGALATGVFPRGAWEQETGEMKSPARQAGPTWRPIERFRSAPK